MTSEHAWPFHGTVRRGAGGLFGYIEGFYDSRPLHSTLGYISPAQMDAERLNPVISGKITATVLPITALHRPASERPICFAGMTNS